MAYGDKTDYRKIQIYVRNIDNVFSPVYVTTWAKTCKEAALVYANKYGTKLADIKTRFA